MTPDPLPPPRIQPAYSGDMVRRLQIGVAGVLVVLLLVGLAGIIGERGADQAASNTAAGTATVSQPGQMPSDQPLVDLGVQPANTDPASAAARAPAQPGTTVPDLAADPALNPAEKRGQ